VIAIDKQRNARGTTDALRLLNQFGSCQQYEIWSAQNGQRGRRAREKAHLKSEMLSNSRRERVEHRRRSNAIVTI
jgi:hypothetical protein